MKEYAYEVARGIYLTKRLITNLGNQAAHAIAHNIATLLLQERYKDGKILWIHMSQLQ